MMGANFRIDRHMGDRWRYRQGTADNQSKNVKAANDNAPFETRLAA